MSPFPPTIARCAAGLALVVALTVALGPGAPAQPRAAAPAPSETGCTSAQRRAALRGLQSAILEMAPGRVESLGTATQQGGPLAGWQLSHGHVVLASAGGVAVDNVGMRGPMPLVLLYAPSPSSEPEAWLDWDGEDGPYHLVGWSHIAPWTPDSTPPSRWCLLEGEWLVHEAGWHTKDGGMVLTPEATGEPSRPDMKAGVHFWHPRAWAIHLWVGDDGLPTVAFHNPRAAGGGLHLPEGAFFYPVNGRKELPPRP